MTKEELSAFLKSVPITVGGYAVFKDNVKNTYYFVERPTKTFWMINKHLWYDYAFDEIEFNKYQLLSYS